MMFTYPYCITALFTIAKRWKQPACLLTNEWISRMWHIDDGILFTLKKESNPVMCTAWMNLEDLMLSKISQSQRQSDSIYEVSKGVKFIETDRIAVTRDWGVGDRLF